MALPLRILKRNGGDYGKRIMLHEGGPGYGYPIMKRDGGPGYGYRIMKRAVPDYDDRGAEELTPYANLELAVTGEVSTVHMLKVSK